MAQNENNILGGILKYSVSTWINLFAGFFSVIITTRLLSPDVYGQIALFESFTTVMIYILTLGMDGAFIRFYNEPPTGNTVNQLLYKNMLLSFLICIVVALISLFIYGDDLSKFVFDITSKFLIFLSFVYTFNKIILRYLTISYRMSFRVKKYTIQDVLFNNLTRVLIIISVFFTVNFLNIIETVVLGNLLILLFYLYIQRHDYLPYDNNNKLNFSLSLYEFGDYIRYALYSAPTYLVHFLNIYLGQQIIKSLINTFALGIFASTNMFSSILMAVKGGFSTYWSAYVYKNHENEQNRIIKMHDYIVLISIVAISFIICFRDVIYLFIGETFHDSKKFFSLLLVMPILSFIMETTDKGIYIRKKNQLSLASHVISVVVNLLGCYLLIPKLGLIGCAFANALSAIILYSLNTFWGQYNYKSMNSRTKSSLGVILLLLLLIIPSIFYTMEVIWFSAIVIDLVSFFIYRKQIIGIYQKASWYFNHKKS